ncbi:MAG: polyribonucleotide nucleotidyltransferase, partial [Clostridiales bacterium]|nr:polyribonucleotide nucleotidyltransferase [Clostridiales bacterium]
MQQIFETTFAGRNLKADIGKYALLSNGAVLLSYGDTVVLVNANRSEVPKEGIDFFPLSVDYEERLYSVGKIPGGFIKREGRPTEKAILSGRAIDRPIRPLFPKGYYNDVQVICTVMSVEPDNPPEILAMNGASLALHISDIPFEGPVGTVLVGRVDGNFIINPNSEQRGKSDFELTVCSTKEKVMMIEAGGKEVPEDVMIDAIMFGFNACQEVIKFQEDVRAKVGKEKVIPAIHSVPEEIEAAVREFASDKLWEAFKYTDRQERQSMTDAIKEETFEHFAEIYPENTKDIDDVMYRIQKGHVRKMILDEKRRPDGRAFEEIRPLYADVD